MGLWLAIYSELFSIARRVSNIQTALFHSWFFSLKLATQLHRPPRVVVKDLQSWALRCAPRAMCRPRDGRLLTVLMVQTRLQSNPDGLIWSSPSFGIRRLCDSGQKGFAIHGKFWWALDSCSLIDKQFNEDFCLYCSDNNWLALLARLRVGSDGNVQWMESRMMMFHWYCSWFWSFKNNHFHKTTTNLWIFHTRVCWNEWKLIMVTGAPYISS